MTAGKELLEGDVRAARVRIVFRNVLSFGERSVRAAEAGACAGRQGRFWHMHEVLFREQPAIWNTPEDGAALMAEMRRLAEGVSGIDRGAFASCLESRATLAALRDAEAEQRGRGFTSQPLFEVFPGGTRLAGAQPVGVYREALTRAPAGG